MKKEWLYKNKNFEEKSLIKRLLISRGIKNEKDIEEFLNPLSMDLTSPNVFVDMPKVVQRLVKAIEEKETVVIYGDFDADGVTSTSILYKTLRYLGADVHYFIPNRESEGHGFDKKALIKLMTTVKPKVIISVDCGISDSDAVKFINSFKIIDVIITDHHEAPEELPQAFAIINPKSPHSLDENLTTKQIEHLTYFAGCGVAFKVAQAILSYYSKTEFLYELLPFVAVGTVADVVPLLGENRYFVAKGLELISGGKHYGLKKLLESAGYDVTKGITSENIAFGIAPRINASGRLDTVDSALKVLISENTQEIEMAITNLNELNQIRQKLCQEIFDQADIMVRKEGNKNPAIVLYNEDWHIGIIGIVASKLVEKYYKPVFLMSYSKENQSFRCSARSIEGVPLYDVLAANSELFDGFGGHKLAAGLSFSSDKTSFDEVKKALNETVKEYLSGKDLKPYINIDLVLEMEDVTFDFVEQLSQLEPFGASNPSPIFEMNNLKIVEKKVMGEGNSHLKLTLNKNANTISAIWWQHGGVCLNKGDNIDIAFHPQINEFNGNISVQLIVDDIHCQTLDYEENLIKPQYRIYDNRTKTGILPEVNDYIKNSKLNIRVFAESKTVVDKIKSYSQINNRIFTREEIPNCDVVMFFDYPADRKTLDMILEKSQPKSLHFMNYEQKIFDETELLKVFTGMLKYASHNNNGKVELVRCSSFLGKSVEILEMLLELFEEVGFIKIKEKSKTYYKIEFIQVDNLSKILKTAKYGEIYDMMLECEEFQKNLLEEDLEQLIA